MTDLLAYHIAKDQMADLRKTAGETRLTSTTHNHRSLTSGRRVIRRMLGRMSTALSTDRRTTIVASQSRPVTHDAPNHPARETR